jgi:hypothetical protein
VTTLNQAWGTQFTSFDEIAPPPAAELCAGEGFHNPASDRRSYDFKRFLAEGRADYIEGLARAVKESASRPVLVAAWGVGDGGHRRDNTVVSRLLRSPHIDAYFHQPGYGVRLPPAVGGMNALLDSYTVNGKIFLADMDHRLWTGRPKEDTTAGQGVSYTDDTVGRAKDMAMQRDMWRREFARLWAAGHNGATLMNFGPTEEWANPEIREEIARIKKFGDDRVASAEKPPEKSLSASAWDSIQQALNITKKAPKPPVPEVAFIFDEEAVDWARSALPQLLPAFRCATTMPPICARGSCRPPSSWCYRTCWTSTRRQARASRHFAKRAQRSSCSKALGMSSSAPGARPLWMMCSD